MPEAISTGIGQFSRTLESMGKKGTSSLYSLAERHLARAHPEMKSLIARVGGCTLQTDPNAFRVLVRSISALRLDKSAVIPPR